MPYSDSLTRKILLNDIFISKILICDEPSHLLYSQFSNAIFVDGRDKATNILRLNINQKADEYKLFIIHGKFVTDRYLDSILSLQPHLPIIIMYDRDDEVVWIDKPNVVYIHASSPILTFNSVARNLMLTAQILLDPLTNVYNLRAFQMILAKEIAKCERFLSTFALIFVDIDKFKTLNDTYGHVYCNTVLQKIVKCFKTRAHDYIFRVGGDEFIILLPLTGKDGVMKVMSRIHRNISNEFKDIQLTCSLGCSFFEKNDTIDKIVGRADFDMYKQKK